MLQARINELYSAVIDIDGDYVVVTGFLRPERLHSYLHNHIQCFSSKGVYPKRKVVFRDILTGALMVVRKNGKEIARHQYQILLKDTIKYKALRNEKVVVLSVTFMIRKHVYNGYYHFVTENESLLFKTKEGLDRYLMKNFNAEISY